MLTSMSMLFTRLNPQNIEIKNTEFEYGPLKKIYCIQDAGFDEYLFLFTFIPNILFCLYDAREYKKSYFHQLQSLHLTLIKFHWNVFSFP